MQFINSHSTKYLDYVIFYDAKWHTLNDFEVIIWDFIYLRAMNVLERQH